MTQRTVTLAHYYTTPEVQAMADKVGDSLDLSLYAQSCNADTIVFAGVRFMAETAKILNPNTDVILPDEESTCSLVTQTDLHALRDWRQRYPDHVHVAYINSSAAHKTLTDWIVTSRNADDIIAHLYDQGQSVIFSPDRNMGAYLNETYGYSMPLWSAVCEVHDQFNQQALDDAFASTPKTPYLIAHPESPLPVLRQADYVGSTAGMLNWIINFKHDKKQSVIFIATESGILYNMKTARPELDLRQAPIYSGCQCVSCPYMKKNTVESIKRAQKGIGLHIDYLKEEELSKARLPLERMLAFSQERYKIA